MSTSTARPPHRSQNVAQIVSAATVAPAVTRPSELVASNDTAFGRDPAVGPAPAEGAQHIDGAEPATPAPDGSAVSEVLTRLEAAYRERVNNQASALAPAARSTPEHAAAPRIPADNAGVAAAPAANVPAQPVAVVSPAATVTQLASAVAPVAVAPAAVAPVAVAPVAVAPVAVAPVAAAEASVPPIAAQGASRPTEIHYGDVNQNTYITNVRQGDVYLIQMQQLAVLQYMQLLGLSSGLAARGRAVGGGVARPASPPAAFSSGITNPDNPWGFKFAPPNLVR